jgi:hypothetical protein
MVGFLIGKTLLVKYLAQGQLNEEGQRQVFFDVNGLPRSIFVADKTSSVGSSTPLYLGLSDETVDACRRCIWSSVLRQMPASLVALVCKPV